MAEIKEEKDGAKVYVDICLLNAGFDFLGCFEKLTYVSYTLF